MRLAAWLLTVLLAFFVALYATQTSVPLPSGSVLIIAKGSCPDGFWEMKDLDGRILLGTKVANGNIGTLTDSNVGTVPGNSGNSNSSRLLFTRVIFCQKY